jgi:hypothetical protein
MTRELCGDLLQTQARDKVTPVAVMKDCTAYLCVSPWEKERNIHI